MSSHEEIAENHQAGAEDEGNEEILPQFRRDEDDREARAEHEKQPQDPQILAASLSPFLCGVLFSEHRGRSWAVAT